MEVSLRQAAGLCPILGKVHAPLHRFWLLREKHHPSLEEQQQRGAAAPKTLTSPHVRGCEGEQFYLRRPTMTCPCPWRGHLHCDPQANPLKERSSAKQNAVASSLGGSGMVLEIQRGRGRSCCCLHHPALRVKVVGTQDYLSGFNPNWADVLLVAPTGAGAHTTCFPGWEGTRLRPCRAFQGPSRQQRHHHIHRFLHIRAKSQSYKVRQVFQRPQNCGSDLLDWHKLVQLKQKPI